MIKKANFIIQRNFLTNFLKHNLTLNFIIIFKKKTKTEIDLVLENIFKLKTNYKLIWIYDMFLTLDAPSKNKSLSLPGKL